MSLYPFQKVNTSKKSNTGQIFIHWFLSLQQNIRINEEISKCGYVLVSSWRVPSFWVLNRDSNRDKVSDLILPLSKTIYSRLSQTRSNFQSEN